MINFLWFLFFCWLLVQAVKFIVYVVTWKPSAEQLQIEAEFAERDRWWANGGKEEWEAEQQAERDRPAREEAERNERCRASAIAPTQPWMSPAVAAMNQRVWDMRRKRLGLQTWEEEQQA